MRTDQAIVVVGPSTVSGPGPVDAELAAVALECVDDELALVENGPVSVDDLWRDVLASAVGGAHRQVVLVHPSWWPASRVDRLRAAAHGWSGQVVVSARSDVLAASSTVVELAKELVVVHADGRRHAIARGHPPSAVLDAVAACLDGLPEAIIDVPSGVGPFGTALARTLRRRGVAVTVGDDRTLVDAVRRSRGEGDGPTTRRRISPGAAAAVLVIAVVSGLAAAAVGVGDGPPEAVAVTWLVEGRVAVEVPARWTVERITSGPGSARVQVVSPDVRSEAIHVTQSSVPGAQTLDAAADSLRAALAVEPEGVFVDFDARGERAHRPAVTYRELRADRHVDWTVLLDRGVRIAIGCQSSLEQLCDRAVRSAHAVTRK